ncbi:hypothetical protein L5515_010754 [Caenorhabditis briggsae]|uniref:Uncharacterized protein n=1 Tax=Caenorhabditis briggsae TaxID=6238 RepID=A0AAE9ADP3_CAEBR|nr:hypothetical protein L3Y34_003604 [Caenorhabditis briggsae]UMM27479.1 hypothetical protein L5515_010754 [Caenorhabditis briggsae]
MSTIYKLPNKFNENIHLFISSFFVSVVAVFSFYHIEILPEVVQFDYNTIFLVFLVCSLPFVLLDPPIWYCIFMTSFSHFLCFKEFYTLSLVTCFVMVCGLIIKSEVITDFEEKEALCHV